MSGSMQRIWGMVLRNLYLLRSSWPRLFELAYWPTFSLLIWGFLSQFLMTNSSYIAQAAGVLISAVLLWDVLFRSNLGLAITFLEEMWSRNLGQLFISPLRPLELVGALMVISFLRTLISVIPAALLAMPLFGVWVFDLGFALAAFFFNLMVMGWAIGLFVTGLLLRMGLGAEGIVWTGIFLIAPVTGIYYPISVLPEWLQPLAWSFPSTYVFEGMRAVMFEHVFRWDLMMGATLLNVVYLIGGAASFLIFYRIARVRGLLLQQGD
ncbi:MAG: transporter [Rhodospirillales bacterium]|jgi:ABC-2 type transport system permease protein|nr:transporter [Rhodospirillales bacterium]